MHIKLLAERRSRLAALPPPCTPLLTDCQAEKQWRCKLATAAVAQFLQYVYLVVFADAFLNPKLLVVIDLVVCSSDEHYNFTLNQNLNRT